MTNLLETVYKPDVLSCLSDLSNDEVFTPPEVVNQMLDLLPEEIWSNPNIKVLDPACKSGVFLREAAKRFIEGEKAIIPDLQERIDHIMHNQLYGISITEITSLMSRRSLYCSKYPNGQFSVSQFDNIEGLIRFKRINHTWSGNTCKYCGASKDQYDRSKDLETHAYEFIHLKSTKEIEKMHFDVIISNPPYQLQTQENSRQAKPIYHLFIEQAKKLNPRYITMIVPSRWFSGGMGLEKFRSTMLNDNRISTLVDYPNSHDVFSGVDVPGGICYFLWDKSYQGDCKVTNYIDGIPYSSVRPLNEYPTFVRYGKALPIIKKVFSIEKPNKTLENTVSSAKPFGLPTNYKPLDEGIPCLFIQKYGMRYADPNDVVDSQGLMNKWKLLVPRSPIAGQTDFTKPVGFYYDGNTAIVPPGTVCTESYLVAGAFDTEEETSNFKSYLFTKTVRFLLLQAVVSQDVLRNIFCFVPALKHYDQVYTDELLRQRWNISDEEWEYIDSRIHNYDSKAGD